MATRKSLRVAFRKFAAHLRRTRRSQKIQSTSHPLKRTLGSCFMILQLAQIAKNHRIYHSIRSKLPETRERRTQLIQGLLLLAQANVTPLNFIGFAQLYWICAIQTYAFASEREAKTDRAIPANGPLTLLSSFLDSDEIICVGGRLKHAPLSFENKHPVIFAAHLVVNLLVRHTYIANSHSGVHLTLATLRQKFWILRA